MKTQDITNHDNPSASPTGAAPTLLQVMDFLYALEHSIGMRYTTRWGLYLSELRDDSGDAVFTGDIYTHDEKEPPRFYRWLRFRLSQTKGIHNLEAYEDYRLTEEIPAMDFFSFMDYTVKLFEPCDFSYTVPEQKPDETPARRRKTAHRSRKKPTLQELFDFCYDVSHLNGGILSWSVGVRYVHDGGGRLYYEFSPGRHRPKGVPVQRFFPNISFCYSEDTGIYAVLAWENQLTPIEHKKLPFHDLKALVCRLYQIGSNSQCLPPKEI